MAEKDNKEKLFKSSEEVVSMFLGLLVVIVVVGLVINMISRNKGKIDAPGVTDISSNEISGTKQNEGKKTGSDGTKSVDDEKKLLGNSYVVKKGDNLWKIATEVYGDGFQWKVIAAENKISTPNILLTGQRLVLPNISGKTIKTKLTKTIVPGGNYKIEKGDSLWKIAVWTYGDGYRWTDIWKENKIKIQNPDRLMVGTNLMIPASK